jgi:two-component system, sensor histidine kinase and response regulator
MKPGSAMTKIRTILRSMNLFRMHRELTRSRKENATLLATLMENIPQKIFIKDRNSVYRSCNASFARGVGLSPEDVIGKTDFDFSSREMAERIQNNDKRLMASGIPKEIEADIGIDGTETWIQAAQIPLFNTKGDSTGLLGIYWDISERKKLEKEQREADERTKRLNDELEERVRARTAELETALEELKTKSDAAEAANRTKSAFIANMSHEIRTPLNAVIGLSSHLEETLVDQPQREYLKAIRHSGESLLTLIDDVLDLSAIESGRLTLQPGPLDLRALIDDIVRLFGVAASRKGIGLDTDVDPELPDILMLDRTRLRQILLNVVGNAVKFTDSGRVVIRLRANAPGEAKVVLPQPVEGAITLVIEVEDTGIGIPEADHEAIFETFRQQSPKIAKKYGGTGLGLSISRNLLAMMGGTINVDSEPESGSIFTIVIGNVSASPADGRVFPPPTPVPECGDDSVAVAAARALSGRKCDTDGSSTDEERASFAHFAARASKLLTDALLMEDIRRYAADLVATGKRLSIPELSAFGKSLTESAAHFDINFLRTSLKLFAGYKEEVKGER